MLHHGVLCFLMSGILLHLQQESVLVPMIAVQGLMPQCKGVRDACWCEFVATGCTHYFSTFTLFMLCFALLAWQPCQLGPMSPKPPPPLPHSPAEHSQLYPDLLSSQELWAVSCTAVPFDHGVVHCRMLCCMCKPQCPRRPSTPIW